MIYLPTTQGDKLYRQPANVARGTDFRKDAVPMCNWISTAKRGAIGLAAKLTGNETAQATINRLINWMQILHGVGSGCDVTFSGEREILRSLAEKVKMEHITVFDIGANQGQFLREALRYLKNRRHEIHSFEPGTGAYEILYSAFHTQPNVSLNHNAVGNVCGKVTLWFDAEGSAGASLSQRDLSHLGREFLNAESVTMTTVDRYCETKGIEFVDLLKIDVEGHELDVLTGAKNLFDRGGVGMVLFEFGGCNVDSRVFFRDLWSFFNSVNMRLGRLTPTGYVTPLTRYSEALEQYRTTNFIAVPNA